MNIKNAMMLLGLTSIDTKDTIKSKWRIAMKENHPDKFAEKGEGAVKEATEKSKLINEAYEFIIEYIDCFGMDDIEATANDTNNTAVEDFNIQEEVFDGTFTDSLYTIWLGFDHPDSNFLKNVCNYTVGEHYTYYVKYSYADVDSKVKVGDNVKLATGPVLSFVSSEDETYRVVNNNGIEEDDRFEEDYYDESILYYIYAGFVSCSEMVVESLDPLCIRLSCTNNFANMKDIPKKVKRAIKSTYVQTLIAYKKIYKPEIRETSDYITFKRVYLTDINKSEFSTQEIFSILGDEQSFDFTKKAAMFYHYGSRMKLYHGHLGVLHFDVSLESAEDIFACTYVFDKIIHSTNFQQITNSIQSEKNYVKRLETTTAVTTIKVKRAKNGNVSYNFDTVFYYNDGVLSANGEHLLLN